MEELLSIHIHLHAYTVEVGYLCYVKDMCDPCTEKVYEQEMGCHAGVVLVW